MNPNSATQENNCKVKIWIYLENHLDRRIRVWGHSRAARGRGRSPRNLLQGTQQRQAVEGGPALHGRDGSDLPHRYFLQWIPRRRILRRSWGSGVAARWDCQRTSERAHAARCRHRSGRRSARCDACRPCPWRSTTRVCSRSSCCRWQQRNDTADQGLGIRKGIGLFKAFFASEKINRKKKQNIFFH